SGPLAPVTMPPRSVAPILTTSALVCWALSRVGARADSTAAPTAAALKYHVRFVIAALLPLAFCAPLAVHPRVMVRSSEADLPHLKSRRRSVGRRLHGVFGV